MTKMSIEDYHVRPEVLQRIKTVLNDSAYREVIESSSQYNNGIVGERKLRLPYLDSQTGVAQSDCCLWMHKRERMPGQNHGQLYSYPAKRWKKRRRQYLMNDNYLHKAKQRDNESVTDSDVSLNLLAAPSSETSSVKAEVNNDSSDKFSFDNSKETWYQDFDDGSDLPDAGELDDPESDFDDYEEYGSKKKKKQKREPKVKRSRSDYTDSEKPYACDHCGVRYKTRPGLSYHYAHSHQNEGGSGSTPNRHEDEDSYAVPRASHSNGPPHITGNGQLGMSPQMPPNQMPSLLPSATFSSSPIPHQSAPGSSGSNSNSSITTVVTPNNNREGPPEESFEGNSANSNKPLASPSNYCDFCLGDTAENKKTKSAESLVSCSDCGRSAHPTCLQFTPNMIASVKKYRWQCIECKSCGLCGTSDNDVSNGVYIVYCHTYL